MSGRPADVVLLAAGRSSRMGQPKGLVPIEGRPWIEHQLDVLSGRRVILVLGDDHERYRSAFPALAHRVALVVNPEPDRGPFSSLQLGLAEVPAETPAFVLPIDVPAASEAVWRTLERSLPDRPLSAAIPVFDDRGGHPVLLSPGLVTFLLTRPPTGRLDHELVAAAASAPPASVIRVPVDDPRVRLNLNAPQDWGKLMSGH